MAQNQDKFIIAKNGKARKYRLLFRKIILPYSLPKKQNTKLYLQDSENLVIIKNITILLKEKR